MTTDERMERMEEQIARVRWLNRCLVTCVLVALALWGLTQTLGPETAWAQSGAKEIRANKFVLEDENGKVRGELSMGKDGPSLALFDENAKPRALLMVGKGMEALSLWDENGKHRGGMAVGEDGPAVTLTDKSGIPRAILSVLKDHPTLNLMDESGKRVWKAP